MALKKTKKSKTNEEEVLDLPANPIYGWNSLEDVAKDVNHSIHRELLQGEFVCAVQGDWELQRFVVTRRLDDPSQFMVGIICKGHTAYFPKLPKDAVLSYVENDMKDKKVPGNIINDFKRILINNY